MAEPEKLRNQIGELAAAVFDGSIDECQFDQLKAILEKEPEARRIYAEFIGLHVGLQKVYEDISSDENLDSGQLNRGQVESDGSDVTKIMPDVTTKSGDDPFSMGDATASSNDTSSFSKGWTMFGLPGFVLVLFLAAAIGFGWFGNGSGQKVARLVQQSTDSHWCNASGKQIETPAIESLDWCQLKKGMIKVEFRQGAMVLLEGPAQFRILDDNRLHVRSGKLSAKVPDSAHGFTVLAPNVKVVDLGTEFGVDASHLNKTSVQVMTGRVEVTTFDPDGIEKSQQELTAKNCLTVSRVGTLKKARFGSVQFPEKFADASIDLVDLVCGGTGTEQNRGYAIDCLNGKWQKLTEPFTGKLSKKIPIGSKKYHLVSKLPFVDGVFIPNNQHGPMQIDSAGHKFAKFGKTSGYSYDQLMAGATLEYFKVPRYPERLMIDGRDFTTSPHGLLVLRGNKGITFDLNKIRDANPGMKITKFRSLAANTENSSELNLVTGPFRADLWVIIDGESVFKRTKLSSAAGTLNLNIPIPEDARFLTLVSTEGKKFSTHDWIVFANPKLELMKEE